MRCAESLSNRLPNSEDPMFILASLTGLMKATWFYALWYNNGGQLIELVNAGCQKAADLMAGVSLDKFQVDYFKRIGGDQKYRE